MEIENAASKTVANAGLATGIIGTALGTISTGILGGTGLLGNSNSNQLQMDLIASNRALAIAQSELAQEKKMVELFEGMNTRVNGLRDDMNDRIRSLERTVSDNAASQAVINCGFNSGIGILQTQVNQLMGMTKLGIPAANIIQASSGTGTGTGTT